MNNCTSILNENNVQLQISPVKYKGVNTIKPCLCQQGILSTPKYHASNPKRDTHYVQEGKNTAWLIDLICEDLELYQQTQQHYARIFLQHMVSRDGIQLEHALALERLPLPHIIKVLMLQRHPLDKLRDHDSTDEERLAQCTAFMLACYNQNKCNSMSDARFKLWSSSRRTASAPKVKSLPPTGFAENIERAHFTVAQFRKATEPVLIPLQPTGWILEGEILNPTTVDRK